MKYTLTYNHQSQFIEMFGNIHQVSTWDSVLTITNGKKYPGEYCEQGPYKICGSGGPMGFGDKVMCPANTIILGRKGNINSPIYMDEPYWIVDTAFCLNPKEQLHPIYLYYWCKQFDFTKLNKQAVLPSLTKNDLYSITMGIPQMDSQEEFASIVRQADKSKFELKKAIEAIDQVIKSLING